MINILDIIVLAFILLFFIISYKKGFVKSVWRVVAIVVTIAAVMLLKNPTVSFLAGTDFAANIETAVAERIALPAGAVTSETAQSMNIPTVITNQFLNGAVTSASNELARSVTMITLQIIAFVALFIIIRIALHIAFKLLDSASKLPVISVANRLLGGVMGIAAAVIIISVVFAFISLFARADSPMFDLINGSLIVKYFYNYNIILQLIMQL